MGMPPMSANFYGLGEYPDRRLLLRGSSVLPAALGAGAETSDVVFGPGVKLGVAVAEFGSKSAIPLST